MEELKQRVTEKIRQHPHLAFDELWTEVLKHDSEISQAMDNDEFARFVVMKHNELSSSEEREFIPSGEAHPDDGVSDQQPDLQHTLERLPQILSAFEQLQQTVVGQAGEIKNLKQAYAESVQLMQAYIQNPDAVRRAYQQKTGTNTGNPDPASVVAEGEATARADPNRSKLVGALGALSSDNLDKINELARNVAVIVSRNSPGSQPQRDPVEQQMKSMLDGVDLVSKLIGRFLDSTTKVYETLQTRMSSAQAMGVDQNTLDKNIDEAVIRHIRPLAKKLDLATKATKRDEDTD